MGYGVFIGPEGSGQADNTLPLSGTVDTPNTHIVVFSGVVGSYLAPEWSRSINGGAYVNAVAGSTSGLTVKPIWVVGAISTDIVHIQYIPGSLTVAGVTATGFTDFLIVNNL